MCIAFFMSSSKESLCEIIALPMPPGGGIPCPHCWRYIERNPLSELPSFLLLRILLLVSLWSLQRGDKNMPFFSLQGIYIGHMHSNDA